MLNFVSKSYVKEINRFLEGKTKRMKVPEFPDSPIDYIKEFIHNQRGGEMILRKQ